MAKKAAAKDGNRKKKRTVSGRRGTASQHRSGGTDVRSVAGVILTCLGLISLAAHFIPSSGGLLVACTNLTQGLSGMLCLLLPLVVCCAGVALAFSRTRLISRRTVVCVVLIFLFVEALLELFRVNSINILLISDGKEESYLNFLKYAFNDDAVSCKGGGLLGALLAWPLVKALDVWGAVVALIFACAAALLVLTGMSAGSAGMALSSWLDDLRADANERREEREALREAREEAALSREEERAQRRVFERMEREAQREEPDDPEDGDPEDDLPPLTQEAPEPQPRPGKGKAGKAKLHLVDDAAQERGKGAQTPAAQRPARQSPKPRPKRAAEDTPLYIERDDEFAREGIDERKENRGARRRQRFTIEEAEQAFLHGATFTGYDEPRSDAAPDGGAAGGEDANPQQAAPEAFPAPDEPAAQDGPTAYEEPDADGGTDETEFPEETAQDGEPDESPQPPFEPRQPVRRTDERRPVSGSVPSSIPVSGVRAPRASAPEEDDEEKVITQLRGSRMDGTPLVMPKKEEHEEPKARQDYTRPPIDLLARSQRTMDVNQRAKDEAGAAKLLETLESFGVQAKLTHVTHGPAITRYEVQPAPGVKVSRIVNLVDDIALNMASDGVRIEAPIPGKPAVGIEIPNEKIETVSLRDVLESPEMQRQTSPTAVALGKGISGAPVIADMAKMPHVLIAGATGSGKSVCINTIINSIIYRASPRDVRLILIDPKVVELSVYNGIPHLLVPVVTDPKKASAALSWAVVEMEHRYKRFESMGVREIGGYNRAIGPDEEPMSKIIVIIDELADLMMVAPGEVEESICRLAQLARAAGIHLVIATQRPSVNVITGVIKANIPSRIAFAVSSQIDSRTILDASGAEKLLGKGDMLYAPQGAGKPTRVQGCFLSDEEVQRVVDFVRNQHEAEYSEDVIEQMDAAAQEEKAAQGDAPGPGEPVDEMLQKAIELAIDAGQVSISMLQRRLRVGYARAGRLVDEMTLRGITAEAEGPTKPRAVLVTREEWRRMQENGE